jgi:cytochrome c-type biogenesis protein CcmE
MFDSDGVESKVLYFGGKPQDFEKLDQIVLVGSYNHDNFVASQLLLKCPSKYDAGEFADSAEY